MNLWQKFWAWYDRHHTLNVTLAAGLFSLQLIHLYWLTTEVVMGKIWGRSFFFTDSGLWELLLVLVDYAEIPAIIMTSLVYLAAFRRNGSWKSLTYLFLLNSQWVHIFWITDEVVVTLFDSRGLGVTWPPFVAWIAILIDYLELPVIYETIREAVRSRSLQPLRERD